MPLVSVIVPVYKVEKYLGKCIESILNQTYRDMEIILVDDGSPDKCGELCEEYAKKDCRILVIHKENGGLGDARNAGIEKASGKYLLFVDSDDYIHEKLLEKTVKTAEETKADMVLFDYQTVEPKGGRSDIFTIDMPAGKVITPKDEPGLIKASCSAVNKLYRTNFWHKSGLHFPVGKYYEDLGTIPKLFGIAERVVYIKEALYYYVMRDGSIMHSSDFKRNYEDRTAMLDGVLTFFEKQGIYEDYRQELEYLVFENGYYVPSKELVLNGCDKTYLKKFREYAYTKFPDLEQNRYVGQLSGKEKILWTLLKHKMYRGMIALSYMRRVKDTIKPGGGK